MDKSSLDVATQQKLQAFEKLLSYEPNNVKMLAFHKSPSKTRLLLGGKRSGKTTTAVVECCWAGLGIHPFLDYPRPPLKIRFCSVDFNTARLIALPMFQTWIPRHAIVKYWPDDRVLELRNGTLIDFRSYDQDLEKFEGVERHLVAMDEEPPKSVYQSNYMRTISGGINGRLIISCTPLHGMSWLYTDLYDNPEAIPPAVEHWHVTTLDNPHLDRDAINLVFKDPAMKDNVEAAIYGRFFAHQGLIYPMFNMDKHVIKPLDEGRIPPDWLVVVGIDPHDRNPHGVVFCGLTPENVFVVFDELLDACIIPELVAKIRLKLKDRWPPNLAIIDTSASTPQSITGRSVSEELMQKHGLYVLPAHKDIQAGRLKVSSMLDPGGGLLPKLYVTENCHNLIRQFRHYMWDDWANRARDKLNPKERPRKKDDHLLDALRYVTMAQIIYRHPSLKYKPKIPEHKSSVTGYF